MISRLNKNKFQINIISHCRHHILLQYQFGMVPNANMFIPDMIPIFWKYEKPMLIWYLFNKCVWLGVYQQIYKQYE